MRGVRQRTGLRLLTGQCRGGDDAGLFVREVRQKIGVRLSRKRHEIAGQADVGQQIADDALEPVSAPKRLSPGGGADVNDPVGAHLDRPFLQPFQGRKKRHLTSVFVASEYGAGGLVIKPGGEVPLHQ